MENRTSLWFANRTQGTVERVFTGTAEECKAEKDRYLSVGISLYSLGIWKTTTGTRFGDLRVIEGDS